MEEIIAERRFDLLVENEERATVIISITKPQLDPNDNETWVCQAIMNGPGVSRSQKLYGADSMAVLKYAVALFKVNVEYLQITYNGKLTWLDQSDLFIDEPKSS